MTSISTKAPRHSMPTTMFPHVPGTTSLQRKFLWLGDPSMESHYGKALDFLQEPKEDSLHSSALNSYLLSYCFAGPLPCQSLIPCVKVKHCFQMFSAWNIPVKSSLKLFSAPHLTFWWQITLLTQTQPMDPFARLEGEPVFIACRHQLPSGRITNHSP